MAGSAAAEQAAIRTAEVESTRPFDQRAHHEPSLFWVLSKYFSARRSEASTPSATSVSRQPDRTALASPRTTRAERSGDDASKASARSSPGGGPMPAR